MNLPALQFTPPSIVFDFETLKHNIEEITTKYEGLVVGEDDVTAIKSELAALNHLAKGLADARKDAVAKVSAPIKDFEAQVKEMETLILATRGKLDEQVKAFVQKEREGKRASVQFMIDALKDEFKCTADIPIQESWLNKTAKDTAISAEIKGIILKHQKQEQEARELEQAKKDRVVAMESHIKAMQAKFGYEVPFSAVSHLQGLDTPLQDVYTGIEAAFEKEGARLEAVVAAQVRAQAQVQTQVQQPTPQPAPRTVAQPLPKTINITAAYLPANAEMVRSLCKQLEAVCVSVSVQVK